MKKKRFYFAKIAILFVNSVAKLFVFCTAITKCLLHLFRRCLEIKGKTFVMAKEEDLELKQKRRKLSFTPSGRF